jgi:hypothetical protein
MLILASICQFKILKLILHTINRTSFDLQCLSRIPSGTQHKVPVAKNAITDIDTHQIR